MKPLFFVTLFLFFGFTCTALHAQQQSPKPQTLDELRNYQDIHFRDLDQETKMPVCAKVSSVNREYLSVALSTIYPKGLVYQRLWERGNGNLVKTNFDNNECSLFVRINGNDNGNSYNNLISCRVEKIYKKPDESIGISSVGLCKSL
jgi:hypothetical protein